MLIVNGGCDPLKTGQQRTTSLPTRKIFMLNIREEIIRQKILKNSVFKLVLK